MVSTDSGSVSLSSALTEVLIFLDGGLKIFFDSCILDALILFYIFSFHFGNKISNSEPSRIWIEVFITRIVLVNDDSKIVIVLLGFHWCP